MEAPNNISDTANIRKKVIELRLSGYTFSRIGRETGFNRTTARYYVRRYAKIGDAALKPYQRRANLNKQDKQRRISQENLEKAITLCKETPMRLASIAKTIGIEYHKLYYHIRTRYPEIIESRRTSKPIN